MATVHLQGQPVETCGDLPGVGDAAPDFTLTKADLSELALGDLQGKRVVLNVFVSLDTSTCAASVRRFNEAASKLEDTVVLCASMDLPFAQARFCGAEGLDDVVTVSAFRNPEFGEKYGLTMCDGPMRGLLSRAVVVIDERGKVVYTEHVSEISEEPAYEPALAALGRD